MHKVQLEKVLVDILEVFAVHCLFESSVSQMCLGTAKQNRNSS